MKKQILVRNDDQLPEEFDGFLKLEGEEYRNVKNRRTHAVTRGGKKYFIKIHFGVGWKEIFKNLLQFKMPIVGAENEWIAIQRLHDIGVNTMNLAAYGKRGSNLANLESFVMTDALKDTESLEDFCPRYFSDLTPAKLAIKRAIIKEMAIIAKKLHHEKLIHCDLYICHFHLDLSCGEENLTPQNVKLYVIDLHRVRFSPRPFRRWQIKDLAAIYFSCLHYFPPQKTDLLRFIKFYRGSSPTRILRKEKKLWQKVEQRAFKLYRKISFAEKNK